MPEKLSPTYLTFTDGSTLTAFLRSFTLELKVGLCRGLHVFAVTMCNKHSCNIIFYHICLVASSYHTNVKLIKE